MQGNACEILSAGLSFTNLLNAMMLHKYNARQNVSSATSSQQPRNDFKCVHNDSFLLASKISKTLCKEPHNCFIISLLRVGFSAIVLGNILTTVSKEMFTAILLIIKLF